MFCVISCKLSLHSLKSYKFSSNCKFISLKPLIEHLKTSDGTLKNSQM